MTAARAIGSAVRARTLGRLFTALLIFLFLLAGIENSLSQVACKPLLSVKSIREVRASSVSVASWKWHATIVADARYCATRSGNFEIDFVRIKDNAPDIQFTEKFRWQQDQFDVSMDLTMDESILEFRVGFIAPCVCRPIAELSNEARR